MKYTLITLAALSSAAFAQTIVNGDFSDTSGLTPKTGGFFNGIPNGWTSTGPLQVLTPDYYNDSLGFGMNYVDLGGFPSQPVTVSQVVSGFTPGQVYALSYQWGNMGDNNQDYPYDMTIAMGGASATHKGVGKVLATDNTFTFTATNASETLSITFNATNGASPTGIDSTNFRVTPVQVPEPSSAALLGLGGLALILRRRK